MNAANSKVIVIDDEEMLRRNLAAMLEDEGFEVTAVENGEDALQAIQNGSFDAAIVDMRLPGIDGNEVILRAHALLPDMRFIIYTGSTDYAVPDALAAIGLDEAMVFHKPADGDALIAALRGDGGSDH